MLDVSVCLTARVAQDQMAVLGLDQAQVAAIGHLQLFGRQDLVWMAESQQCAR